jgi:hypothetical protein
LQEEAQSDAQGTFRVRGLHPGCKYQLRVRTDNEHTSAGAYPSFYDVEVVDGHVHGLEFVIRPVMSEMHITGHIHTAPEHLSKLTVVMYSMNEPDKQLHSVHMQHSRMFFIQHIPIDNQQYVLRVRSSAAADQFDQSQLPEIVFTANESAKFINLEFNPKPKTIEVEISKASYAAIPVGLIIAFIVYNYKTTVPMAEQLVAQAADMCVSLVHKAQQHARHASPDNANQARRRVKTRKT